MKFIFTKHALERLVERFPKKILDNDPKKSMAILIYKAKEYKSILNNTRFFVHIMETYGTSKPKFLINDDVVFVCSEENKVITVVDSKNSFFENRTTRYRKSK